jgi:excisionase family DNA binding protein
VRQHNHEAQASLTFPPALELRVPRVAEMLGCSGDTVIYLLKEKKLRGYQTGARGWWVIDYQSVVEYMAAVPNSRGLPTSRVARIIGCSHDTVLRLIEEGRLKAHRWRQRGWFMVDYQSLVEYLASLRAGTR